MPTAPRRPAAKHKSASSHMPEIKIVLDNEGNARHLIDEQHAELYAAFGPVDEIYRNSHVEPTLELSAEAVLCLFRDGQYAEERMPFDTERRIMLAKETEHPTILRRLLPKNRWWADMLPCGARVVLGPFDKREEALAAEIDWLVKHHLPVPQRCQPTTPTTVTTNPAPC